MADDASTATAGNAGRSGKSGKSERGRRISPKLAASGLLGLLLLLFGVLNTDDVGVDFIIDTVKAPLILVIALSATLGLVIGILLRGRHRP
jgi:uncharacterized integral membrane protein